MISKFFISCMLAALSVVTVTADVQNFCNSDVCKSNPAFPQHITCTATGSMMPSCPKGARYLALSDAQKQKIVDLHNQLRNKIAGGQENGYNSAARMTTMSWNEDLAQYAVLNVQRCKFEHDCHNTDATPYAGQNIYISTTFGGGATFNNPDDIIHSAIVTSWWDSEKNISSQAKIDSCCGTDERPHHMMNHFLQECQQKANQVGCAISQYKNDKGYNSYIACNYNYGIIPDMRVYDSGAPVSKCASGNNPDYPNLCSEKEQVDSQNPLKF